MDQGPETRTPLVFDSLVALDQPVGDGRDRVGLGQMGYMMLVGCEPVVEAGGLGLVRAMDSAGGMAVRVGEASGCADACRRSRAGDGAKGIRCEANTHGSGRAMSPLGDTELGE